MTGAIPSVAQYAANLSGTEPLLPATDLRDVAGALPAAEFPKPGLWATRNSPARQETVAIPQHIGIQKT